MWVASLLAVTCPETSGLNGSGLGWCAGWAGLYNREDVVAANLGNRFQKGTDYNSDGTRRSLRITSASSGCLKPNPDCGFTASLSLFYYWRTPPSNRLLSHLWPRFTRNRASLQQGITNNEYTQTGKKHSLLILLLHAFNGNNFYFFFFVFYSSLGRFLRRLPLLFFTYWWLCSGSSRLLPLPRCVAFCWALYWCSYCLRLGTNHHHLRGKLS